MTDAAILKATYADMKIVRTRGVLQIVLELPLADAKHALDVLGMPNPAAEQWCALAPLKPPQEPYNHEPAGASRPGSAAGVASSSPPADSNAPAAPPNDTPYSRAMRALTPERRAELRMEREAKTAATGQPRPFETLPASQQAGIKCCDPDFMRWLNARDADHASETVRGLCGGLVSRAELDKDHIARAAWVRLLAAYARNPYGVRTP